MVRDELSASAHVQPGRAIADGTIVTHVGQAYTSGAFRQVPMMIGATSGDMAGRTGVMVGGARQIAGMLADNGVATYYYRFSYVAESLKAAAARHATNIPFFMNTRGIKDGEMTRARDNAAGRRSAAGSCRCQGRPKEFQRDGRSRYQRRGGKMMNFSREGTADDPGALKSMRRRDHGITA